MLKLHGVVQGDWRDLFSDNALSQGNDGFLLRRARPIVEGTMFRDFDYLVVADFAGSSFLLFDAYINYRVRPELQFRVGKFRGPVGLENLQDDMVASFNERSLASDLAPMRNLGVQLSGFGERRSPGLGRRNLRWRRRLSSGRQQRFQ